MERDIEVKWRLLVVWNAILCFIIVSVFVCVMCASAAVFNGVVCYFCVADEFLK